MHGTCLNCCKQKRIYSREGNGTVVVLNEAGNNGGPGPVHVALLLVLYCIVVEGIGGGVLVEEVR